MWPVDATTTVLRYYVLLLAAAELDRLELVVLTPALDFELLDTKIVRLLPLFDLLLRSTVKTRIWAPTDSNDAKYPVTMAP